MEPKWGNGCPQPKTGTAHCLRVSGDAHQGREGGHTVMADLTCPSAQPVRARETEEGGSLEHPGVCSLREAGHFPPHLGWLFKYAQAWTPPAPRGTGAVLTAVLTRPGPDLSWVGRTLTAHARLWQPPVSQEQGAPVGGECTLFIGLCRLTRDLCRSVHFTACPFGTGDHSSHLQGAQRAQIR